MGNISTRKQIGGANPPFSLAFLSCVGYYGYIYIIAILAQINALQVRPYMAGLDRLWWNYDAIQEGGPVPLIFSSAIKIHPIRKT